MAAWIVRAGARGEYEETALGQNVVLVSWDQIPDLGPVQSREQMDALFRSSVPLEDVKPGAVAGYIGQLWALRSLIQVDELVALPLKGRAAIAVGRVTGPYRHRPDLAATHTRAVRWLATDIPRSTLDGDILSALYASQAVCRIPREDVEARLVALAGGRPAGPVGQAEAAEERLDLESYALDEVVNFVGRRFTGHRLASLVSDILLAQGYTIEVSPPGPDGGVDILAGCGHMGFESPSLCVQVKSGAGPVDVNVLRSLEGVLHGFGADHGLLVSWGGFTGAALSEARSRFFKVRLWSANDLIRELLENYEQLPGNTKAEIPLKRVWALVLEEE